jgi:hypothetical protein
MAVQPHMFPEIEGPDFIRSEAIAEVGGTVLRRHGGVGGPLFELWQAVREDEIRIIWLRNDKPWDPDKEEAGHDVAGKCIKAPGVWHDVTGFDYAIWIRGQLWDEWDERTREAAILHELLHAEVARDKDGQAKARVRKHDVEDFVAVARHYGPIFGEAAAYVRVATVRPAGDGES